jgi:hypothetical protein
VKAVRIHEYGDASVLRPTYQYVHRIQLLQGLFDGKSHEELVPGKMTAKGLDTSITKQATGGHGVVAKVRKTVIRLLYLRFRIDDGMTRIQANQQLVKKFGRSDNLYADQSIIRKYTRSPVLYYAVALSRFSCSAFPMCRFQYHLTVLRIRLQDKAGRDERCDYDDICKWCELFRHTPV